MAEIEGTVQQTNRDRETQEPKGIKVGDEWFNWTKKHDPDDADCACRACVQPPRTGAKVILYLDDNNDQFVNSMVVLEQGSGGSSRGGGRSGGHGRSERSSGRETRPAGRTDRAAAQRPTSGNVAAQGATPAGPSRDAILAARVKVMEIAASLNPDAAGAIALAGRIWGWVSGHEAEQPQRAQAPAQAAKAEAAPAEDPAPFWQAVLDAFDGNTEMAGSWLTEAMGISSEHPEKTGLVHLKAWLRTKGNSLAGLQEMLTRDAGS